VIFRLLGLLALWPVVSYGLAVAWWHLAANVLPPPPGILPGLLHTDGESSYDAMFLEMFLICAAITGTSLPFLGYALGKSARRNQ
jgi:hypothetical protein